MDKLDNCILYLDYIKECLMAYKSIKNAGKHCNICNKKNCKYRPELGELIRFNCPLFDEEDE